MNTSSMASCHSTRQRRALVINCRMRND
jgi:hypothetical protein